MTTSTGDLDASDRAAVHDLMVRFATGLDHCDWPMYRSAFTEEIDLDYSSWRAGSIGRWRADDWVARAARTFPGLTATRHALTNVHVTRLADGAVSVRANVCADHVLVVEGDTPSRSPSPPLLEVFTLNGWYDDRCVRTDDGWRITAKRLVAQWTVGDRALLDRAAARVAAGEIAERAR